VADSAAGHESTEGLFVRQASHRLRRLGYTSTVQQMSIARPSARMRALFDR
jgi:hypothetical protein